MKIKKLAFSCLSLIFSLSPGVASSQYLGLDQLAVTQDYEPQLLLNAIQKNDWNFIARWEREKGFKFPYSDSDKVYCTFQRINRMFKNDHPLEGVANKASLLGVWEYPFFTSCARLPILHLQSKVKLRNTPSIQPFYPDGKVNVNSDDVHQAKVIYDFQMKILDDLEPNQWDLLVSLIVDNNADAKLRSKALDKFLIWYPNRMKTATENQKVFWQAGENIQFKGIDSFNQRLSYSRLHNPINYMFEHIMRDTMGAWQYLSNSALSNQVPKFDSEYWKSARTLDVGNFNLGDLKKVKPRAVSNFVENYYLAHTNGELLKRLMKAPGFDINQQDPLGNTFIGSLFVDTNLSFQKLMAYNLNFAIFIRYTLENKANPMMLNADGYTTYMLFDGVRSKSSGFDAINDAFVLKEYPH